MLEKVFLLKNIDLNRTDQIWKNLQKELGTKTIIIKPKDDGCSTGVAHLYSALDLKNYLNKQIEIGIRPEDIFVSENTNASCDCKLKVMAYENMGNEQLVYLSLAHQTIIARRPPADTVEIGQETGISFSKNKIIFMQEEGGEVIANAKLDAV